MGLLSFLVLSVAVLFTSVLSGLIGMAGGVTLLAVMTFFLNWSQIIPLHGTIQLVSNGSRAWFLKSEINTKIFLPFLFGVPFGAGVAIWIIQSVSNEKLFQSLIAFLILYTLFKPKKMPAVRIKHNSFAVVGALSTFLGLLVGATGPFIAVFFLRDDLTRKEIVATKAAVQMLVHIIKIPVFLYLDFPYKEYALPIVVFSVLAVIGTKLGIMLLGRISEKLFRYLYQGALFIAAIRLLYISFAK